MTTTTLPASSPTPAPTKGAHVAALLEDHPGATRAQIAALAACTVGRVGEIVRARGVATSATRTKGDLIAEILVSYPQATRSEVATMAMCTVGRVGEVIRAAA